MKGFLRRRSLRVRITLTYVVGAAALAGVLGLGTFVAARTVLQNQRVTASTRQTVFGLLFAREFVGTDPGKAQRVVQLLQTREGLDAMVTQGTGTWFASAISLTPDAIPQGLRTLVERERLGYQVTRIRGERYLIYGAPLPPAGVDLYLLYSLSDLDQTLSVLARVLLIVSLVVVAVAAGLALRVSRRILQPLAAVSEAAQRVAEGLLETRVDAPSADELGVLAASFNEMASALQEMLQRERRFVAGLSHELRTPLSTLDTTSRLLASHRDELSDAGREAVDLVVEDVHELRRLVEDLLEVSELDAGSAQVRREEVDLRALAQALVRRHRRDVAIDGPSLTAFTDKARVERILGNLLDNAFDHGEGRAVRVRIWREGERCLVGVSDEGPGLDRRDAARIFDRFYKADASRTRERGGVGLGLAIASQNAGLLGGTIDVISSPGAGATFVLKIPVGAREPAEVSG